MSYIIVFLASACVAYLITPTIRFIALKFAVIDYKGIRKVHNRVVARFGGLSLYVGFIFAMVLAFILEPTMGKLSLIMIFNVLLASTLVLLLGIYDDVKGANAATKFIIQLLAALIVVKAGFVIKILSIPFGNSLKLGIFSIPFTILWLVAVTNAINLIDGLDGLAAGIVAINSLALAMVYFFSGQTLPMFFALALTGACLGFLPYNYSPAKIFMGDTGSLFLGFSIATLSIFTCYKSLTAIGLLIPMLGLAVPIVDTGLAFLRRILRGDSPFKADKQHIHHWLLKHKFTGEQTVWVLWIATVIFNIIAIVFLVK